MTHRGPLLTLAVVAAFFLALLIANFLVNPTAVKPRYALPPVSSWSAAPTSWGSR